MARGGGSRGGGGGGGSRGGWSGGGGRGGRGGGSGGGSRGGWSGRGGGGSSPGRRHWGGGGRGWNRRHQVYNPPIYSSTYLWPYTSSWGLYDGYGYGYGYSPYTFYSPTLSTYGSCDCAGDQVTRSDCNQGYPICISGNCACANIPTQTIGCFEQRDAVCM